MASSLELLVGQSGSFSRTVCIVAEHHERYDGSGYRSIGLERIGLAAEGAVRGLVDTYCAMTRDRVFSPAISSQGALEAICRAA